MPAELTNLKVRDVTVKLHRVGRGPTVLFLHGAGGVPQWLPFFDALAERYELLVPEHPGFGGSDDPPRIHSISDLAMFYLDLVEARPDPSDRQLARRLARRRNPDPRPLALSEPRPAGTRRHPYKGRAMRRQLHLGAGGGGAQPLSRSVLRRAPAGIDAERRADGRDAEEPLHGGEARLAAARYNPDLEKWLHRINCRRWSFGATTTRSCRRPMPRCGMSACRMHAS